MLMVRIRHLLVIVELLLLGTIPIILIHKGLYSGVGNIKRRCVEIFGRWRVRRVCSGGDGG